MGRRIALGAAGIAFAVMAVAGIAWACTADAYITLVDENGGPVEHEGTAGSEVIVEGKQWREGQTVEIYFDSAAGPLLAMPEGAFFKVNVRIPQSATPGYHVIYARTVNDMGEYQYSAQTAFHVLPPPTESVTTSGGAPQDEPVSTVQTVGSPAPARHGADRGERRVFAGSLPASEPAVAPASVPADAAAAEDRDAQRSVRKSPPAGSGTSDLGAGFEAVAGPPLVEGLVEGPEAAPRSPVALAGVVLLAAGMVLTACAGLIAATTRRRAPRT